MTTRDYSTTADDNTSLEGIIVNDTMLANALDNSVRQLMADSAAMLLDIAEPTDTSGSLNAYVLATAGGVSSYVNRVRLTFRANFTNTGSSTINVDGLGAVDLKVYGVSGLADLSAGQIQSGSVYDVVYVNALSDFVVMNPTTMKIIYANYAAFKASTEASRGVDAIWDYTDGKGVEVASGGNITNSAGTPVQLKVISHNGALNVKAFGAVADSTGYKTVGTDSSVEFQKAIDAALVRNLNVFVPSGKYYAHDLIWGEPENYGDGLANKGIKLYGSDRQTSVIYTFEQDFIDLGTFGQFKAHDIAIISSNGNSGDPDYGPKGNCLWSSATTEETGLAKPRQIHVDLERVEMSRFDIMIGADGFWGSSLRQCKGYFNRLGLDIDNVYNVVVTNCDWLCQSALILPGPPVSFTYTDNHHALGTWKDIFGTPETTIDMNLGNVEFHGNYFENYGESGTNAYTDCTVWRFSGDISYEFDVSSNYINTTDGGWKLRSMHRFADINSIFLTRGQFRRNQIVTADPDNYWIDTDMDTNEAIYYTDDKECTVAGTKIIATNMQRMSVTGENITYTKGGVEPPADLTTFTSQRLVGDVSLTPPGGGIDLRGAVYDINVSCRGSMTPDTPSAYKQVVLRISASGVNYDFLIVDAVAGTIFRGSTMRIYAGFDLNMTVSYHFPVALAVDDVFLLNQITVGVEPVGFLSTLTAK